MIILAASLLLFSPQADTLTLQTAYNAALTNWPTVSRTDLRRSAADLESDNLSSQYYPSLSVRGQAVYHSSVTSLPIEVPGVGQAGIPKDQYFASLNVDQLLYDGGEIATRKRLAEIGGNLAAIETEVELHQVRDRVNGIFFDVVFLESQIRLLALLVEDLESRLGLVRAGIDNGTALKSDADVLEAELIGIQQELQTARIRRSGKLAALSHLTGRPIEDSVVLQTPDFSATPIPTTGRRPEFAMFAERDRALEASEALSSATTRPHLSGFGQAGYGKPADLDLFKPDFATYFVAGVRLNWRFWDWSQSSRKRQINQLERDVLSSEEEAFSRHLAIESEIQLAEIARLDSTISGDERIIQLRQRVAADAATKLENGVITATDYLIERNKAHRAELQRALHETQRTAARVQYATTIGAYL